MGLFSFNKDAGAKSPEISDESKANFMEGIIKKFNFEIEDLDIKVKNDLASVWGKVKEQSVKEKVILGIGNIAGISKVEDFITIKAEENAEIIESKFHTVKKGDSLSKISKEVYGDAMKYNVIFEANKPMLKNVDLIYPGQVLRIPEIK